MRAVQISSFPPPPLCNMCNVQARQWFPFLKPQGEYRCQPCRRIEPQTSWPSHVCGTCGVVFKRKCLARDMDKPKFCSIACNNRRPSRLVHGTERIKRAERLATAPGLTYAQVKALRAMWKRQGRRCTYCGWRAGNTIDHVVPLARGGSNYEGNLAPACKSCNSSKSGRLLIEWKQRPSKEA